MRKNRIKELRELRGMTQYQLGLKFRKPKDPTTISRWERGRGTPSTENLFELARILQVDPNEIFLPSDKTDSQSTDNQSRDD
nr:MAG: XRE family transcriptional regulator [Bacillota bacterium]